MDFITNIPPSFNCTISWVIDQFSKMVHFVPLPCLPSVALLASNFFNHICMDSHNTTWIPPVFWPRDKVWLSLKYIRLKVPCFKLASSILQINPICYKLILPSSLVFPMPFYMSLLKPLILNRFSHKPVFRSSVSGPEDVFEVKIFEVKCLGENSTIWSTGGVLVLGTSRKYWCPRAHS